MGFEPPHPNPLPAKRVEDARERADAGERERTEFAARLAKHS